MLDNVKSNFFDFIRWFSACFVLIGHIPMVMIGLDSSIEFNHNFIYFSRFAHPAVILFFLLSGYLIAYTVSKKSEESEYTFKEYFFDRTSRIYSVLLYSLILTILCDIIGRIYFESYSSQIVLPQDNYILRLVINLLSLQGIWNNRVQFGSNPALWSIGYEYCFYILFGLIYFKIAKSKKVKVNYILVILIISLIRGFPLIYYFLIWLMGVFAYRMANKIKMKCSPITAIFFLSIIFISAHIIYINEQLGSNELFKDAIFGLVICICMIFNYSNYDIPVWFTSINKFFSSFSFSLYAYHLPILYLMSAILFKIDFNLEQYINFIVTLLIISIYLISYILFTFTEEKRINFRIGLIEFYSNLDNFINKNIIKAKYK